MEITKLDTDQYSFVMNGAEADRLMFALSQCESTAANDALSALGNFFGYVAVLKSGDAPILQHSSPENASKTIVTLQLKWTYMST